MSEKTITAVLIENNKDELKKLRSFLKNYGWFAIAGMATSGKTGFQLVLNYTPDIVFVNVELQDINGLEFIRVLNNRGIFPEVVFLAGDPRYAFESLELEPLDYFVKPLKKEIFDEMLSRYHLKLRKTELLRKMDKFTETVAKVPKRIFPQKTGIIVVELREILFVKASLTKSVLMLRDGTEAVLKSNLNQTLEIINHPDFIRSSRSYYINRNYLRMLDTKNYICHLCYNSKNWQVPASRNTINQLENLISFYPE